MMPLSTDTEKLSRFSTDLAIGYDSTFNTNGALHIITNLYLVFYSGFVGIGKQ